MTLIKVKQPAANYYNGWIDGILNDFTKSFERTTPSETLRPQVNITETANAYQLELAAPGRTKEDFKINIDKNLLTVSYEKKEPQKNEEVKNEEVKNEEVKTSEVKYIKREFSIQPFRRSFTLDDKIESDNIKVKYENGLLVFTLPKKADVETSNKTITVE